jgi:hypothetical protein
MMVYRESKILIKPSSDEESGEAGTVRCKVKSMGAAQW